jgi:hypothetical protein
LVSFVQPNKRDKPNKPNNRLLLSRCQAATFDCRDEPSCAFSPSCGSGEGVLCRFSWGCRLSPRTSRTITQMSPTSPKSNVHSIACVMAASPFITHARRARLARKARLVRRGRVRGFRNFELRVEHVPLFPPVSRVSRGLTVYPASRMPNLKCTYPHRSLRFFQELRLCGPSTGGWEAVQVNQKRFGTESNLITGFIWLVWSIWSVWFNQTNETN